MKIFCILLWEIVLKIKHTIRLYSEYLLTKGREDLYNFLILFYDYLILIELNNEEYPQIFD